MASIKRHFKFLVLVALVAFVVGALTGSNFNIPQIGGFLNKPFGVEQMRGLIVPGVDAEGNGIASVLTVTVKSGTGQVLVNINNVLAGFDTQDSAKVAAHEAAKYAGVNLDTLDIIYSIEADVPLVSGSSAGAAMTISTIAAIEGKALDPKVSITGAITNESTIIQVGSVEAKALAVKAQGVEKFLVPSGQGAEDEYQRFVDCETLDGKEICRTNYSPTLVSIGDDLGIQVIEVSTIEEALPYFIN